MSSAESGAHHWCPRGRLEAPHQDQGAQRDTAPYLGEARLPPSGLDLCHGVSQDNSAGVCGDNWDAYREKGNARQQGPGIAPADAELSCHDPDVPGQTSLPLAARRLLGRMMEVFGGFLTHADHQARRLTAFPWRRGEMDQHADHGHLGRRR